ncbi:MAG: hypothetical protein Q9221_008977 [Calogaya cf. arnoldii]
MERRSDELGSDAKYSGSSHQSMKNLEETPHSDTASINSENSNQDDQSAVEGAAEGIELVGTRSLDTTSPESNYDQSRYSLDVLVENHRDSPATASSNSAAHVALPGSDASTSPVQEQVQEQPNTIDNSRSVRRRGYFAQIRRLYTYLPHLNNVRKRSRAHHRAELRCLDFDGDYLVWNRLCTLDKDTTQLPYSAVEFDEDFIQSFMGDIPSEVDCRVLLVDELSDTLMDILGSCLHITPEFFEEHLLNSGWHSNNYNDREADMWSTRNLAKNYASIRWHRPVERRVTRPFQEQASDDLLSPWTTPEDWVESSSPQRRILHSTEPVVNLLRRPWEVRPGSGGFSAWEERATVWETTVGSCPIGEYNIHDLEVRR